MEEVWVRRQWNDLRVAKYQLSGVERVHWGRISGGCKAIAPQSFLHGYVWCSGILEGELGHSCTHGPPPHRIKVCIVKKDNDANTYARLVALAGGKLPKEKRVRTFWQWLKTKKQTTREDAIGELARRLTSQANRPSKNTLEAWKRCLGITKHSLSYAELSAAWREYENAERTAARDDQS